MAALAIAADAFEGCMSNDGHNTFDPSEITDRMMALLPVLPGDICLLIVGFISHREWEIGDQRENGLR